MQTDAPARPGPAQYLAAIEADSARVVQALSDVEESAAVPTCPGWTALDLARHLAEVQHAWAGNVREGVTTPTQAEDLRVADPLPEADGLDATLALLSEATGELLGALRGRSPEQPAWSWASDQTIGFVLRRQAHEACVHRLDAELTAAPDGSARTLVDAMLAADGVDELLHLVAEFTPAASHEDPAGRPVRVVASDTGTTWLVTVDAGAGAIDVATADPADGTVRPQAILTGTGEDLLCAFWGRPPVSDLHRVGHPLLIAELESILTRAR
ncbi:maleylpyruvate isomerase N-terminal domain-containing protein [Mobilicoccus sp.]|uniref:maleylpyruvate isomerase N-terminal domain-containing protein n=1 Tax=Mobilicoccus sp. TaxID=2034349 RepID=UPI0028967B9E|nr:maleylpyruvate isomerase N-terminal domain-containing protein [Mobilicoccus sp.]